MTDNIIDITNIGDDILDIILGESDDLPARRLSNGERLALINFFGRSGVDRPYDATAQWVDIHNAEHTLAY